MPSGWKYKARNALMYFPEGKSESWINEKESRGLPKSIEYQNTHIVALPEVDNHTRCITDFIVNFFGI